MLNVFFHTAFVFVDKMNLVSEWFDHTEIAGKTSQYWRLDGWQMEEVFFGYLPLSQGGSMDQSHVIPQVLDLSETLAALHTDDVPVARFGLVVKNQFGLVPLELPQ